MKEALDITLLAIEGRVRLYRRMVVVISAVLVICSLSAVLLRSWTPLSGLILLVPVIGGFFVLDSRRLQAWQRRILQLCDRGLDLAVVPRFLYLHPLIPKRTLEAMLDSLTKNYPDAIGGPISQKRVAGFVKTLDATTRRQQNRTILGTVGLTAMLILFIAAASYPSRPLTVGFFASLIVWLYSRSR